MPLSGGSSDSCFTSHLLRCDLISPRHFLLNDRASGGQAQSMGASTEQGPRSLQMN